MRCLESVELALHQVSLLHEIAATTLPGMKSAIPVSIPQLL